MSNVAVAILNYNGRRHLEQFLPSVVLHSAGAEIIVIDNGSTDDSVDFLQQHFSDVKLLLFRQNFGFCGGYNRALQQISQEYVVLLNSDVEVTPGWLSPLVEQLDKDDRLAACQPKIKAYLQKTHFEYAGAGGGFIDRLAYPFCRGRLFDSVEQDEGQYDDACAIFWASGACMMVRRKLFLAIGGFEERFFAHMEEIDLCWRWQHLGYMLKYCPQSTVYHLGAGTLQKTSSRKTYLNFHNGLCMLFRNYTGNNLAGTVLLRLILDGLAGVQLLLKGKIGHTFAIIKAHFTFYAHIGYWVKSRNAIQASKQKDAQYCIYPHYLIWEYFIKQCKTFNALRGAKALVNKS